MNDDARVYDPATSSIEEIVAFHHRGVAILCPKCHLPLTFAMEEETAAKHRIHPGIYCLVDPDHFTCVMHFQRSDNFWGQFGG